MLSYVILINMGMTLTAAVPTLDLGIFRRATTPASSSVCTTGLSSPQICVAVNIPNELDAQNDMFLKVTGPATKQYTGIGFAGSMSNCLMLLIFPTVTNTNVTASMRLSTGHTRPALANTTFVAELLPGTTSDGTTFTAHVRCRNCRNWSDGAVNPRGAQDFIYAYGATSTTGLGGDQAVTTYHGPFSRGVLKLDLASANGPGQVPTIDPTKVK